jgi:hypothetical protein
MFLSVPRTARNKQAAEMGTFEAQSFDDGFVDALLAVFKKFQSGQGQNADRNFEYAYHDQKAYIGRYHRTTANDLPPPSTHSIDARVLAIVAPGSLGTLFWKPVRCRALQDKTVVVDINYSELNFKVFQCHGHVPKLLAHSREYHLESSCVFLLRLWNSYPRFVASSQS